MPLHKALAVPLVSFWCQETDRRIQSKAQVAFTRAFNLVANQMRVLLKQITMAINARHAAEEAAMAEIA